MTSVDVRFVASVSPIVRDGGAARRFYGGTLGLPLQGAGDDEGYVFTERLGGVKHFGLWPLSEAAQACFGSPIWPAEVPVPQVSIEFEVDDVAAAAEELRRQGHRLLHDARTEPWTQVTARLLTSDGVLVAVCQTPWLRRTEAPPSVRQAFRSAVDAASAVLASPLVASRWETPSTLKAMTVGDLAAHLVRAVATVEAYLARPAPTGQPISAAAYFLTVLGGPGDHSSDQSRGVRERARHDAEGGHEQVLRHWEEARGTVAELLATEPPGRLLTVADELVLTLDDYLETRIVELVVHLDDLTVSLGLQVRPPPDAARVAEQVLLDIARRRHGDTDVLRVLARRERAPADVVPVL